MERAPREDPCVLQKMSELVESKALMDSAGTQPARSLECQKWKAGAHKALPPGRQEGGSSSNRSATRCPVVQPTGIVPTGGGFSRLCRVIPALPMRRSTPRRAMQRYAQMLDHPTTQVVGDADRLALLVPHSLLRSARGRCSGPDGWSPESV